MRVASRQASTRFACRRWHSTSHWVATPEPWLTSQSLCSCSCQPLSAFPQDAGGRILSKAAVAGINGVTVDAFDVTNSTFDFAWNGTQAGFASQAQARLAFLDALRNVRDFISYLTFMAHRLPAASMASAPCKPCKA